MRIGRCNLRIGLANAGNRVLVIDADPQGSLSASLGYREPDELKQTLATVLGRVIRDEECDWKQLGIRHHEEGIDVLPVKGLEQLLITISKVRR